MKHVFTEEDADWWWIRNEHKVGLFPFGERDPVLDIVYTLQLRPENALEIGCANGWRLRELNREYGTKIAGTELSKRARNRRESVIKKARQPFSLFDFKTDTFDTVILGFCMYLMNRDDLFMVAREVDRVLQDRGYVIIHDFIEVAPQSFVYKHNPKLRSYKMDYAKMFLWNPAYRALGNTPKAQDGSMVRVLQKSVNEAWPRGGE